jgi:hypothetical protein
MNVAEFEAKVKANREALKQGKTFPGMFACADCGTPLQEEITGNRELSDGSHVCSDCYFDALGNEIEKHPIAALKIRHFK